MNQAATAQSGPRRFATVSDYDHGPLPASVLDPTNLASESRMGVLNRLLGRPDLPGSAVVAIRAAAISHRRFDVAWVILSHPNFPADELRRLATKPEAEYGNEQDSDADPWEVYNSEELIAIAQHPNCPPDVLHSMVDYYLGTDNATRALRTKLATHSNTSLRDLDRLGSSNDIVVRMAVARNHNTPITTLRRLTHDSSHDVQQIARQTIA